MTLFDLVVRLLLATVAGGLIGAEREFHDKAAGFRTITFICLGSTLFTILSLELGGTQNSVRIAASIVSGIGFIGAGVILRDGGHVVGLTTASTIWIAAALGMGIGAGYYQLAGVTTGLVLIGLWILPHFDRMIHKLRETRTYRVILPKDSGKWEQVESLIDRCELALEQSKKKLRSGNMVCEWRVHGPSANHTLFVDQLILEEGINEFLY